MNKPDLIEHIAICTTDFQRGDIKQAVDVILSGISDSLIRGERVEVRGFGSFGLRHRSPRMARNPKTGEAVSISERYVPYFKPGKELRERVNDYDLSV